MVVQRRAGAGVEGGDRLFLQRSYIARISTTEKETNGKKRYGLMYKDIERLCVPSKISIQCHILDYEIAVRSWPHILHGVCFVLLGCYNPQPYHKC